MCNWRKEKRCHWRTAICKAGKKKKRERDREKAAFSNSSNPSQCSVKLGVISTVRCPFLPQANLTQSRNLGEREELKTNQEQKQGFLPWSQSDVSHCVSCFTMPPRGQLPVTPTEGLVHFHQHGGTYSPSLLLPNVSASLF